MKICILSDIHDNVWNLSRALTMPELQNTEVILFCGDLCAPFIVKLLGQAYSKPIHIVFGNNDGDGAAIIANAEGFTNIQIHGEYFRGELGGRSFAVNHYPDKARTIAKTGTYDVVCYGHNHTFAEEKVGDTLLINPGTIMGFHGGRLEDITPTFSVLDTLSMKTELISLPAS